MTVMFNQQQKDDIYLVWCYYDRNIDEDEHPATVPYSGTVV